MPAVIERSCTILEARFDRYRRGEEQLDDVTALGNCHNLFDMLEETADSGDEIVVNWRYNKDNDTLRDCEEEFGEEVEPVVSILEAKSQE